MGALLLLRARDGSKLRRMLCCAVLCCADLFGIERHVSACGVRSVNEDSSGKDSSGSAVGESGEASVCVRVVVGCVELQTSRCVQRG